MAHAMKNRKKCPRCMGVMIEDEHSGSPHWRCVLCGWVEHSLPKAFMVTKEVDNGLDELDS